MERRHVVPANISVDNVSAANIKFGIKLLQHLIKNKKKENIFFSPFSISAALAMTQLGARENTASEMAAALEWNVSDENVIHQEFQKYLSLLQTPTDKYQLSTANRIYIEESYPILEDFVKKTKEMYMAEPVPAQFREKAEEERVKINTWVLDQTQDKIKDPLAPGVVDSLTSMVLVNAIYFKGQWDRQFEPKRTRPMPFKVSPFEVKQVPTMISSKKYYAFTQDKELGCTALEIPYKGMELSMVIILPDMDFGLGTLASKLNAANLKSLLDNLRTSVTEVVLLLPKFEMTSSFDLRSAMETMGMKDAFNPAKANFSGMTAQTDIYVSAIHHKAFVKVNEEGTEAAAATFFEMAKGCSPTPIFQITVDHPFLFVITDKRSSKAVLFEGVILDPSLN